MALADQSGEVPALVTKQPETQKPSPLSCVEIVKTLADVFQYPLSDRALNAYVFTVGHRSEEDLNKALREILRNWPKMPTPSELLDACGILRERR